MDHPQPVDIYGRRKCVQYISDKVLTPHGAFRDTHIQGPKVGHTEWSLQLPKLGPLFSQNVWTVGRYSEYGKFIFYGHSFSAALGTLLVSSLL